MGLLIYDDHFVYQGSEYYSIDGVCYVDGFVTNPSDYAWARNHYLHFNTIDGVTHRRVKKPATNYLYYITYRNEYGITLYETKKRRWVSRFPNDGSLKTYATRKDAAKSIEYRHRYNDVVYYINKIKEERIHG